MSFNTMGGINLVQNRMKREMRKRRPMAHTDYGWPHYRADTQRCICLEDCCNDVQGCNCKTCECKGEGHYNDAEIQYSAS